MRLFYKILLNLCALVSFLVIFYAFQESSRNNLTFFNLDKNGKQIRINNSTDSHFVFIQNSTSGELKNDEGFNLWCTFCKASQASSIRHKFSVFAYSLINLTTVPLTLNVITDNSSLGIAEEILDNIHNMTGKDFKVS